MPLADRDRERRPNTARQHVADLAINRYRMPANPGIDAHSRYNGQEKDDHQCSW
jgi:DNA-binding NarL/FixJ family response regulator